MLCCLLVFPFFLVVRKRHSSLSFFEFFSVVYTFLTCLKLFPVCFFNLKFVCV